eukprot:scaffold8833_cov58-Phaeocystis_antarctica.AAC.2
MIYSLGLGRKVTPESLTLPPRLRVATRASVYRVYRAARASIATDRALPRYCLAVLPWPTANPNPIYAAFTRRL